MIIYEVNIQLKKNIPENYWSWLDHHISQMLLFKGFIAAKIFEEVMDQGTKSEYSRSLSVHYQIESLSHLEHYLAEHAEKMRAEGKEKFGSYFNATRRVLQKWSKEP